MIYRTSGGDCGGRDLDVPEGETVVVISYADERDRQWDATYELREHDPNSGEKALIYIGRQARS